MPSDVVNSAKLYHAKASGVQHQYGMDLLKTIDIKPGFIVCDVGCGCGRLCAEMSKLVGKNGKVIGIDPNIDRIKIARRDYGMFENIQFLPLKSVQFPTSSGAYYDLFISNSVLHWIPTNEKRKTFARMMESLKPGGLFVGNISFNRSVNMTLATSLLSKEEQEEIDSFYYRETPEILKNLLSEAGFEIVSYSYRYKEMNLGTVKNFLEWITSTYYGKFNFKIAYRNTGKCIEFDRMEDGGLKHTSEGASFVVRKPF